MLSSIRSFASSAVAKVLFFVLIASFAVWGVGDYVTGGVGRNDVAQVGDVTVSASDFAREFDREYSQARSLFGNTLTREQARQLGLANQVLGQLVTRALLQQEADQLGLAAPDAAVTKSIRAQGQFVNPDGSFDRERLRMALSRMGMSEEQFVAGVRADIARGQLIEAMSLGAVAPDALTDALWAYRQERRTAATIAVSRSNMTLEQPVSDAELRLFYDENGARFRRPEFRAVSAIWLRPEDLAAEIAVAEDEIRTLYEDRLEQLGEPERRTIEQILLSDEAAVQKAHARLRDGEDFATVAQEEAGIAADALSLGTFTRDEFPAELADAAFTLDSGAFSAPLQSGLGWHILRIGEVVPESRPTLDDVRDELRQEIALEVAFDALTDLSNRLDDALGAGETLEAAAESIGASVIRVDRIDRNGLDPEGQAVDGIPPAAAFFTEAFEAGVDEVGFLQETDDGFFVLRVDDIFESAVPPLDEIRADVMTAAEEARRGELAEAVAKRLVERLSAGEPIEAAAGAEGFEVSEVGPFDRRGQLADGGGAGLPLPLVSALFAAQAGEAVSAPSPDGVVVARLAEVLPAEEDPDGKLRLAQSLAGGLGQDLFAAYSAGLDARHEVKINAAAIDRLFNPQTP